MNADMKGELGMFNKFLDNGKFIDSIKLQVAQKISFANLGPHCAAYYNLTCERFNSFVSQDPIAHELEIKFVDIPNFLITIRNRFFHSLTGDEKNNITTIEMPDSDEYFERINPVISSFLAIVVLHTIASKYHI